jgi:type I restriction enzyme S subunit
MKTERDFKETEIGMIPKDWEVHRIGDVSKINENTIGKDFSYDEIEYIDIDSVERGRITKIQHIALKEAPSRAKRLLRDNDIIISTVRPNLKHFAFIERSKPNLVVSTGFAVISAKAINPRFLYYYLTTQKYTDYLAAIADSHTSAYPSFNPDIIEDSFLPFPEDKEQERIAKILSDLDSKIEVNHQMNQTLEKMSQALFRHWFIGFEFPNEKGKPYKSSGGEMVESELGEIPKGWEIKEVSDCGKVICGKTPPTKDEDNYGSEIPFITIPDMRDNVFVVRTEKQLSKIGADTQGKKELPALAICVSCIASPGLVALTRTRSHTNQQINSIICNNGISPYFMFFSMKEKSEDIRTMGLGGTATLNLNTGDFSKIKILVPKKSIMDKFHKLVTPIFNRVLENSIESLAVADIRDSLLPRFMSGKIRVNGGQRAG